MILLPHTRPFRSVSRSKPPMIDGMRIWIFIEANAQFLRNGQTPWNGWIRAERTLNWICRFHFFFFSVANVFLSTSCFRYSIPAKSSSVCAFYVRCVHITDMCGFWQMVALLCDFFFIFFCLLRRNRFPAVSFRSKSMWRDTELWANAWVDWWRANGMRCDATANVPCTARWASAKNRYWNGDRRNRWLRICCKRERTKYFKCIKICEPANG